MVEARRVVVTGLVQGVGFRPYVWRLAQELGIAGWVRNDASGVVLHLEGPDAALSVFLTRLPREAPALARIDGVFVETCAAQGHATFVIVESGGGPVTTRIGVDTAPCPQCLAELFDPCNRRYRHPFITCTHCGPRYTITRRLPYDRAQTSLSPFPLCPDCAREYADPCDRRFHAETLCCPACGPRLRLCDGEGKEIPGDAIAATLALLRAGKIIAIKGLGGFHLACDAACAQAVAELRRRKQREEKPFAVMVANAASAALWGKLGASELALLESPARPIVLVEKRGETDRKLFGVAPGLAEIGLMLPATPIQYLLFHEAAGGPPGAAWLQEPLPEIWVMTSANPHGEPLVIDDEEALRRLAGIADAFLLHDRAIVVRCDDSVRRVTGFVRRARGEVPEPIRLPAGGPSVLACGGWFKNTVCLTRGDEAFVSQHIGDLDEASACAFFEETVAHLTHILDVEPRLIAHDLHPDFHSTRFAQTFAIARGLPLVAVQHHQAHIAAVCAEQGLMGPVLGLALDGVGLGSDGGIWGGELLRVEGSRCERLGHLRELPLPGGDRAAKEPWRMAAAVLHALGRNEEIVHRYFDEPAATVVATMLARGLRSPTTSSAGRLFDAVAGLLGVRRHTSFEGQAAMLLEGLAFRHGPVAPLAQGWRLDEQNRLDLLPLCEFLFDCEDAAAGAALFHATFAAALAEWAARAAKAQEITTIVAAGGCLLNRWLQEDLRRHLAACGLRLVLAERLPPNDGSISLGQAWVALSATLRETS